MTRMLPGGLVATLLFCVACERARPIASTPPRNEASPGGDARSFPPPPVLSPGEPIACERDADCEAVPLGHVQCPGPCGFCGEQALVPKGYPPVRCAPVASPPGGGPQCSPCPPVAPLSAACRNRVCALVPATMVMDEFSPVDDRCQSDADCAPAAHDVGERATCCAPCPAVVGTRAWVQKVANICQQRIQERRVPACPAIGCGPPAARCRDGRCVGE